jgi:transcriptional regulator with XRE-family HTH domain
MSEPSALDTPGLARRIATARTVSGREVDELASLLGISYEAYEDLERFDDEAVDVISFDQLVLLTSALALDARRLFDAPELEHASFAELASRLEQLLANEGIDLEALENEVGWELRAHLDDPGTFGELPAAALADIAPRVGYDWRSFLPPQGRGGAT